MATQKAIVTLIVALAAVAIAGSAYLYLERRAAEPVSDAEAEFIAEQSQLTTELMQESLDARIEGLQDSSRERLDSPTGQALMQRCLEWEQLYEASRDEATARNRDAACAEYREFVTNGVLPETTPEDERSDL